MMKKSLRTLFLLGLIFMLSTGVSSAHTNLQESNPADGETITKELNELVLVFETKIESLSTFTLLLNNETEIETEITVDQDTMTGTLSEPLANGEYTVNWDIIGADGHQITGDFSFTVDVQEAEQNEQTEQVQPGEEQNQEEAAENKDEQVSEEQGGQDPVQEAETPETTNAEAPSKFSLTSVIFIVLFVLIVGSLILMLRDKRK